MQFFTFFFYFFPLSLWVNPLSMMHPPFTYVWLGNFYNSGFVVAFTNSRAVLAAGCDLLHRGLLSAEQDELAVILMPDFTVVEMQEFLMALYGRSDRLMSSSIVEVAKTTRFRWVYITCFCICTL